MSRRNLVIDVNLSLLVKAARPHKVFPNKDSSKIDSNYGISIIANMGFLLQNFLQYKVISHIFQNFIVIKVETQEVGIPQECTSISL